MANIRLLTQPFTDGEQTGSVLRRGLSQATEFYAITAWAKHSGLGRLAADLRPFKGIKRIAIGVDEGGATWEGLRLAMELFDEAFVVHDPGPRTFHSKAYLTLGDRGGLLVIGSPNLTKGGLFTNYETALAIELTRGAPDDDALTGAFIEYWTRLTTGLGSACCPLTEDLLETLAEDPAIQIGNEARSARWRARAQAVSTTGVFGTAVSGLLGAPPLEVEADVDDDDAVPPSAVLQGEEPSENGEAAVAAPTPAPSSVARPIGFYKVLSWNDVNPNSSPGQIIVPLAFRDFFPDFSVLSDETASGGPKTEQCIFALNFIDGTFASRVAGARAIVYTPAADAPRKNTELRFTFRDRAVFSRLKEGDVLIFTWKDDTVQVERTSPPAPGSARYARLSR